ncbi:MAG: hypothetical protein ACXWL2_03080 [Candidatus Chromulinivorax sp.]
MKFLLYLLFLFTLHSNLAMQEEKHEYKILDEQQTIRFSLSQDPNRDVVFHKPFLEYKVSIPGYDSKTKLPISDKIECWVSREDRKKIEAIIAGNITNETQFPIAIKRYQPKYKNIDFPPTTELEWKTAEEKSQIEQEAWYAGLPWYNKLGFMFGCLRKK